MRKRSIFKMPAWISPILLVFVMLSSHALAGEPKFNTGNIDSQGNAIVSLMPIVPLVSVNRNSDMKIDLEFTNTSKHEFRYLIGYRCFAAGLDISLIKNGKPLPFSFTIEPPFLSKKNVRSLNPGKSIDFSVSLKDYKANGQGSFPLGLYELRAKYDVPKESTLTQKYGLTPAKFNNTIMLIDIVDEKKHTEFLGGIASGYNFSTQKNATIPNNNKSTTSKDASFKLIPVVQMDKASNMDIKFYIANKFSKTIGYWKRWMNMSHTWHWELIDRKTGKPMAKKSRVTSTVPQKDDIQLLAPEESVLCNINLRDYFSNIPAGRYEFHVYYSIHENDTLAKLGCMPGKFDRAIMLVEMVDRH